MVTPWTPAPAAALIDPSAVMRLAKVMAGRQWRSAAQVWKREDWIGRAVAEAFALGDEPGFEHRAKRIISQLEKDQILLRADAQNAKREVIKTFVLENLSRFEKPS